MKPITVTLVTPFLIELTKKAWKSHRSWKSYKNKWRKLSDIAIKQLK